MTPVKAAGGLFVIGTERHESRRIDNQLRGRSGRQGDPGASRFFLSLEDDLMRIFGSDRMGGMLQRLGLQEGEAIIHPWINKALEKAQKKVETRNFDMRKNVLKYDDVMNDQRKEVYAQRREFMSHRIGVRRGGGDAGGRDCAIWWQCVSPRRRSPSSGRVRNWPRISKRMLGLDLPIADWAAEEGIDETGIRERIVAAADAAAAAKAEKFGPELNNYIEKSVLLQTLDQVWKEHLLALDHLRQGIGLRSYGQRDPLNEYKREAFALFTGLLDELKREGDECAGACDRGRSTAGTAAGAGDGEPSAARRHDRGAGAGRAGGAGGGPRSGRFRRGRWTRHGPRPGRQHREMRPAPAVRARNSNTAMVE